jgi:hypothetical protein
MAALNGKRVEGKYTTAKPDEKLVIALAKAKIWIQPRFTRTELPKPKQPPKSNWDTQATVILIQMQIIAATT